jgi:excisionase family DNA binding protein
VSHSPERPVFLTVDQTAERLACSRSTIWRLLAAGALPSTKIGHLRRIPAQALDDWADAVAGQGTKGGER